MNVLVIAPHPDDEILGTGGTIAKRAAQGHDVYVCIVTKGCEPLFHEKYVEKGRSECRKADEYLGVKETIFLDFPAVMLEEVPRYELNDGILGVIQRIKPEEVYVPHRGDMQIDHKIVVDAAMVALRPKYSHKVKRIYAYETLSETGWDIPNVMNEFIPTVYEDISDTINKKIEAMNIFQSQLASFPNARSIGAIEALARFRGSTVTLEAAEAFGIVREIK
ncbi:PIG-L family deacetylase [Lachnospiraceae bacterium WCA-9-b2]|jgi:LmbE family N-acetylglucosaminyl deacetylase|uniref:asparaginase n=1 Tax=Sporofaciens musculi TaxID=2681861 RepID=A0A7X3MGF4_9FIRM|nr:PIG-L deacetylase family protein [Sporofaciens musculi]MCI9422056.1 PIG-L family deacetylase [Dorea sp.]MXP75976.1 PIG-L family deacetylase [Sporofaciens musculi]